MEQGYIEKLYNYYLWTLTKADPRPKGWLLVDSPVPTIVFTITYLVMVWIGPKIMKNREPYKLKPLLIIYNFAVAYLNYYIFVEYMSAALNLEYSFVCQACVPSQHPDELRIVNATWWYYFSKLIEFADTLFFILRKKDNQLTFLHIYHHSTMFPFWWIGTKWVPTGTTFFPATLNAGVHIIMYSYYGLAAIGPTVAKYLWWKKYITIMQLIQFTLILGIGLNGIRVNCQFPPWMKYTLCLYMISYLFLFGGFYAKAYSQKQINSTPSEKKNKNEKVL